MAIIDFIRVDRIDEILFQANRSRCRAGFFVYVGGVRGPDTDSHPASAGPTYSTSDRSKFLLSSKEGDTQTRLV